MQDPASHEAERPEALAAAGLRLIRLLDPSDEGETTFLCEAERLIGRNWRLGPGLFLLQAPEGDLPSALAAQLATVLELPARALPPPPARCRAAEPRSQVPSSLPEYLRLCEDQAAARMTRIEQATTTLLSRLRGGATARTPASELATGLAAFARHLQARQQHLTELRRATPAQLVSRASPGLARVEARIARLQQSLESARQPRHGTAERLVQARLAGGRRS